MYPKLPNLKILLVLFQISFLIINLSAISNQSQEEDEKAKSIKVDKKITEEIIVYGKSPKDLPPATVTSVDTGKIERLKPLDLSEAIKYTPGVTVTMGDKSEYTLKLRGMDSRRIVLLLDGVPVYEPYFSSFDLKTIVGGGIDSLKVSKGPSSVLYGPNSLGGIVNVITKRPSSDPELSLTSSYGEKNTWNLGVESGKQWRKLGFTGTIFYQVSDGFNYPDPKRGRLARNNTDYKKLNLNAKIYYTPSNNTEILINGAAYLSEYGMPAALEVTPPRYWRFKNWNRYSLNAGGITALGKKSTLHFRTYYVQYDNTLDWYKDKELTELTSESTFDNSVYGFFALADLSHSKNNAFKLSLNYKIDKACTQDDRGLPWTKLDQGTFSIGIEEHLIFLQRWKLVGGLSFDYLNKFVGKNNFSLNPLLGIQFTPHEYLNVHLSFSLKSKFPSMRAMYSPSSGNPDLLSERGLNWEFGFTYEDNIFCSAAAFITRFKDMIDSVRMPDGTRRYLNIEEAYINGFEIQIQKSLEKISTNINYTYLVHKNKSENRPLDALPSHNLNFDFQLEPLSHFQIDIFGTLVSSSSWFDSRTKEILQIPSFFSLDTIFAYHLRRFELFTKVSNVFNKYFYTEPGFPWRGRYFEVGIRMKLI